MKTVFSHIVQKRLSHENENVATDALAYVVNTSRDAHRGVMKLLRCIIPHLPDLSIRTQNSADQMRPDMWGYEGSVPRVFIENKFWAGLTANQPVNYLKHLAKQEPPSLLMMVVPETRQETIWRELLARLDAANITASDHACPGDTGRAVETGIGPVLAITSWRRLLDGIEAELAEEAVAFHDLVQLRSLCSAADDDAFVPLTAQESTDQRIPAIVMHMTSVYQAVTGWAITEGIFSTEGLTASNSWKRFGRYVQFPAGATFGAWFGVDYSLWKRHGVSPLWLVFPPSDWGNAQKAQELLDSWSQREKVFMMFEDNELLVAVELPGREGKDEVIRFVENRLGSISNIFGSGDTSHE